MWTNKQELQNVHFVSEKYENPPDCQFKSYIIKGSFISLPWKIY